MLSFAQVFEGFRSPRMRKKRVSVFTGLTRNLQMDIASKQFFYSRLLALSLE